MSFIVQPGGGGVDLHSPGPIGDVTPGTGAFTICTIGGAILTGSANTLALRNGANAQTFQVYNTYTDGSNYELFTASWSVISNTFVLGTDKAGTGSFRPFLLTGSEVQLGIGGVGAIWKVSSSGHYLAATNNTYDIGGPGAAPRDIYIGRNIIVGGTTYYPHDVAGTLTWTTTP